jgi:hypothetical protein
VAALRVAMGWCVLAAHAAGAQQYPINGDFETLLMGGAPANWLTVNSTVGTTNGLQGLNYIQIHDNGTISSDRFPVVAGQWYAFSFVRRYLDNPYISSVSINLIYLDISGTDVGSATDTIHSTDYAGPWVLYQSVATQVPASARFAQIVISMSGVGEFDLDSILFDTDERWHNVGAPGEIAQFSNGWQNWGSPYAVARYRREKSGWITMEGLVKGGSPLNSTVLTLPVGYRPLANRSIYQIEVMNNTVGIAEIQPGGAVVQQKTTGANNHLSLQVRFRTD